MQGTILNINMHCLVFSYKISFMLRLNSSYSPLVMSSAVRRVVAGMGMEFSFSGWCGSPGRHSTRVGFHASQPSTLLEAYVAGIMHWILQKKHPSLNFLLILLINIIKQYLFCLPFHLNITTFFFFILIGSSSVYILSYTDSPSFHFLIIFIYHSSLPPSLIISNLLINL